MIVTSRMRPRIGDVVELKTPAGLAYAQYTHRHDTPPRYGALIRVLPGTFDKRPETFTELVRQKERFFVFFPLGAACSRGITTIVANEEVPPAARLFPILRSRVYEGPSWWLWDGEREWRVFEQTPEIAALSIHQVVNDTMLADMIADGWSPSQVP